MRSLIAIVLLSSTIATAHAVGLGEGNRFGKLGAMSKGSGTAPPTTAGKILLVDGISFILKTDGVSKVCRAGGC